MDAVTGPVMSRVCSRVNLRPCSVLLSSSTLHKKLTNGAAEAPLPDFFALIRMKDRAAAPAAQCLGEFSDKEMLV
jgi:hypothetical protein